MALELARSGADIACAVGFHSGLATVDPQDARNIKGKVLVCLGADDPSIDAAQRSAFEAEMRDARVDWQMHLYGGVVHSFTNPDADRMGRPQMARYDVAADARSWAAMIGLFGEVLAPR
jgi:dienelactone hydrolase